MHSRQPIFYRRQRRQGSVRLGLIPIGHGIVIVAAIVGRAVLDGCAEGSGEGNRRIEMEAVHRPSGSLALRAHNWGAEQSVSKGLSAKVPGSEEIIFGSRAVDGWPLFAVNKKHVVAFTPPSVFVFQDRHGDAYKLAAAFGIHPQVIVLAVEVLSVAHDRSARSALVVISVEIERVVRQGN